MQGIKLFYLIINSQTSLSFDADQEYKFCRYNINIFIPAPYNPTSTGYRNLNIFYWKPLFLEGW